MGLNILSSIINITFKRDLIWMWYVFMNIFISELKVNICL